MLSRAYSTAFRRVLAQPTPFAGAACRSFPRSMVTVNEALTAEDARSVSGYSSIDYTIDENAMVYDAVQKFAAFNIGALVVTNKAGMLTPFLHFCGKISILNK